MAMKPPPKGKEKDAEDEEDEDEEEAVDSKRAEGVDPALKAFAKKRMKDC